MKQITLRGIDPEVEHKIRQKAKENRQSINQVLVGIIHQNFGDKRRVAKAASLKQLAGTWSDREASDFLTVVEFVNEIDGDMWR